MRLSLLLLSSFAITTLLPGKIFAQSNATSDQVLSQRTILIVKGPDSSALQQQLDAKTRLLREEVLSDTETIAKKMQNNISPSESPIGCLAVYESHCDNPATMILHQLHAQRLIIINEKPISSGFRAVIRITSEPKTKTQSVVNATSLQDLADKLIRHLFNRTSELQIISTPPATAWINGERQEGETPIKVPIQAGKVTIRLESEGYIPVERTFDAEEKLSYTFTYKLTRAETMFTVTDAPSDAQVYLDGRPLGKAGTPYAIKEGRYLVDVYADGYEPYSKYVTIQKGMNATLSVPLRKEAPKTEISNLNNLNPIEFRVTANIAWTGLNLARFKTDGVTTVFPRPEEQNRSTNRIIQDGDDKFNALTLGFYGDISYTYNYFTLTPLSINLQGLSISTPVYVDVNEDNIPHHYKPAVLKSLIMLDLAPAVGFRYPTKYFVLGANLGFGVHFDFASTHSQYREAEKNFNEVYGIGFLEVFGNIHTNSSFFYTVGLRLGFDLGAKDVSHTQFGAAVGIGFSFEDFLGLQPKPPSNIAESSQSKSDSFDDELFQ